MCVNATPSHIIITRQHHRRAETRGKGRALDNAVFGQVAELHVSKRLPWAHDSDICNRTRKQMLKDSEQCEKRGFVLLVCVLFHHMLTCAKTFHTRNIVTEPEGKRNPVIERRFHHVIV